MAYSFLFGGNTQETPDTLARKREMADLLASQLMGGTPKNAYEGIGAMLKGAAVGIGRHRDGKAEKAGRSAADDLFNRIIGQAPDVSASSMLSPGIKPASTSTSAGTGAAASVNVDPSIRDGIVQTASALGVDPVDLATAISYETAGTFDPTKAGPTTKWGKHRGLIQFGEPQAQQYGVNWDDPVGSQLGENGAVAKYLRSTGVKPGMGLLDIYSAINAGGVGRYNASDAAAGGAPGTVRDKVEKQMAGHRAKALALFGDQGQEVASLDPAIGMPPQTAAGAVNALAAGGGGGAPPPSLSEEVAAFEQTPEYQAQFPGRNAQQPSQGPIQNAPQQQPAVPPQFQGSQQLANAQGGIMPALMGGAPASPEQVAQAQAMGQQPPQQAPAQGGPDKMALLQALSNPWLSPEQKAVLQTLYQQQEQEEQAAREQQIWMQRQQYEQEAKRNDPSYQLGLKKTQAELDQMGKPEYQVLTPEERQALGIPETDQRVYQRSRGGKIDAVGGAGQTINVGNEVDARKAAAESLGLTPQDPRYQSFILTGKFPREDAQSLTATDKKAILEADEMVAANQSALDALTQAEALSDKANSGWFAGARASIGNNLPDWMVPDLISSPQSSQATTDMDNAIIGQAITQLKTIFGGNPTEGERNILLELQGSSTMPREVRKQVFSRARALAEKRLQFNNDRAADLRGGTYYKPDRAPATGQNIDDLLKKYGAQ
ncbi:hypothetical protein [Sinorhizobium meliloti]|uniref:hypothetical protein n=1 Tax=Rhizobium meliloti TaxID=382 RepID=UPI000427B6E6|nr:hypothetical protein [Sinorhizobium meliloti]UDU18814.1 hypothetical protein LJD24_14015 [Sinorhizobium meliloti]